MSSETTHGEQATQTHTALIVPVPEARDICRLLDYGTRLRMTAPIAHITIATPFIREADLSEAGYRTISAIAASVNAFQFVLTSCDAFDNGWVFVSPSDPEPFVRLTARIVDAFPMFEPYEGRYSDVIPHLSIGYEADATTRRLRTAETQQSLPLAATAGELLLVRSGVQDWVTLQRFSFASD